MFKPFKLYKDAKNIVVAQAVSTLLFFVLGFVLGGKLTAFSILAGCLSCLLPSFYLYAKAFRVFGASRAKKIVHGFYSGQAGKFALTAVMFTLIFNQHYFDAVWVFVGFIGTQMIHGLVPLVAAIKKKDVTKFVAES